MRYGLYEHSEWNCVNMRGKMKNDDKKPDNPEQSKRFIDTAREREADETEEGADRAFKKAVQSPKK